jgi:hypothetical protein
MQLQKHTARLRAPHLPFLICVGQLVIERLDTLGFGGPLGPFCGVGQAGDEVGDGAGGEELVGAVVERFGGEGGRRVGFRGDLEDGLEDVDVVKNPDKFEVHVHTQATWEGERRGGRGEMKGFKLGLTRDIEQIATVFVSEEVVELIKAAPRDARQAEAAGFVGSEEDAILCRGAVVFGAGEEGLDAVNFAVEEGGEALVVGLDRDGGQGGAGEDGGAKELAAFRDARAGQGDDVGFGKGEEGGDDGCGGVGGGCGGHGGMG